MSDEYTPDDEGPEARLAREEAAAEALAHEHIVTLQKSIPPEASSWPLFTFAERKFWGLRAWRKR